MCHPGERLLHTSGGHYDALMGIVRNSSTRLLAPYDRAFAATVQAMKDVDIDVLQSDNPIVGEAKRSLRKNRWAARITAALRTETNSSTLVDWTVDMAGDKHPALIAEILAGTTVPVDDLGNRDRPPHADEPLVRDLLAEAWDHKNPRRQ